MKKIRLADKDERLDRIPNRVCNKISLTLCVKPRLKQAILTPRVVVLRVPVLIKGKDNKEVEAMDHRILFGFLMTILLALDGNVLADQDEDIPHNE